MMTFLKRITVLIYVILVLFISAFIGLIALNMVDLLRVNQMLYAVSIDHTLQVIFLSLAGVLILVNFMFYKLYSVNVHRDKIVAFDNPSGRVSVSLIAIEDLVRKTVIDLYEVREVKPTILATKGGLKIKVKLILSQEVNIPSLTSKIQTLVKNKIQDMLGVEDPMSIMIYVGKIIPSRNKPKKIKDSVEKDPKTQTNVPFHGYRQ